MRKTVLTLLVCIGLLMEAYSQTDFVPRSLDSKALYQLEWQLKSGNSRYLRDIATFLDRENTRQHAIEILRSKTIFPSEQVSLDKSISKEKFFDFYYTYRSEIKYSHILQMYYTVPLEQIRRDIKSESFEAISPMDAFSKLCLDLQHEKNELKQKENLIALKFLQLHKGVPINKILTCLDIEDPAIQQGLVDHNTLQFIVPNEELKASVNNIMQLQPLNSDFINQLHNMIFEQSDKKQPIDKIKNKYQSFIKNNVILKDSIKKSIEHKYKVSDKYYYNEVDFYGTTLCTKTKPKDDVRLLISNLLDSHDSKVLFYLAAFVYTSKDEGIKKDIIKLMENLTLIKVNNEKEIELSKDLLIYWAQHYQDYTWADSEWRFVSEEQKLAQTKNLERLIRRLNSVNDTIAIQAYTSLTEGDPYEVEKLINKYKKVMKKTNKKIPSLKYNYLETTTKLVTYNKEFEIPYKLSTPIQRLLDQLEYTQSEKERFNLENKILSIAQVKDIPALEYWGILHVANRDNSFSTGRLIEHMYAAFWDKMKNDRQWLTHFIYKAALFKELDGSGMAKAYNKIIDLNDVQLITSLKYIQAHTSRTLVVDYIEEEIFGIDPNEKSDFEKAADAKEELITKMIAAPEIKYSQINQLLDFEETLTTDKEQTLSFIKKLSPAKDIRKLAIKEQLNCQDLMFLKERTFTHREIGSIMRFFNSEDPKANLKFALEAIQEFSLDDQAFVVNRLFRYQWFRNYIYNSEFISQELNQILSILSRYLKESEFIGEIEDRTTQINIIQIIFIGKDIESQLVASIELDVDIALKADLQKTILAKSTFEDLGVILDHVDGLVNNKGNLDLSFLTEDFGIPIFDIATNAELQTFLNRHKNMSVKEFYSAYLEEFGVDFKNKKGELDYEKITHILKYDIIQPFVGKGGGNRDYYVYGITKILEEEFQDNLGFHDKLNNYQTFVHFSSINRAKAWYTYLLNKGYGKETASRPSFE